MKRKRRQSKPRKEGWKSFQGLKRDNLPGCLFLIFSFLLVISCGERPPTSSLTKRGKPASIEKKKMEEGKVVERKEPEKKKEPEYFYNPAGKVDPFKPFIQLTPVKELPRTVPLTPLQKYEITQLKLVAIISGPEGNIALIEDSALKGYIVKRGTWIGKNDGKVTKILGDRLIIEEKYQDIFGQIKSNEISLFLHRGEGGGES